MQIKRRERRCPRVFSSWLAWVIRRQARLADAVSKHSGNATKNRLHQSSRRDRKAVTLAQALPRRIIPSFSNSSRIKRHEPAFLSSASLSTKGSKKDWL